MNSREYKQTIKAIITIGKDVHFTDELIEIIDDLRTWSKKIYDELDYYNTYPRAELDKARQIMKQIVELCNENEIKVVFEKKGTEWFKKGYFTRYWIGQVEITDLIVFRKQDKNRETKPIDTIDASQL